MSSAVANAFVGFGLLNLHASAQLGDFTDGEGGPNAVALGTASGGFMDTMTIYGGVGTAVLAWSYEDATTNGLGTVAPLSLTLPTVVAFGVPFDISVSDSIMTSTSQPFFAFSQVSVLFSFTGLSVNGDFKNYRFSTGSNVDYFDNGTFVAIPEPKYACLVAAFVGLLLMHRPRNRRRTA